MIKIRVPSASKGRKSNGLKEFFVDGDTPLEVLENAGRKQSPELGGIFASASRLTNEVTVFINDTPITSRDYLTRKLRKGDVISVLRTSPQKTQMRRQVYLTIPKDITGEPLIFQIGHEFNIITNIKGASISQEMGVVAIELTGESAEIDRALDWLSGKGVEVEQSGKSKATH